MVPGEGDQWHFSGTTVFNENAHWGGPQADEPDGDEPHEQGHIRAPSGKVAYDKDWDGIGRATDKVAASLRMLHRVRSMCGHLKVVDDEMASGCGGLCDDCLRNDAGRRA